MLIKLSVHLKKFKFHKTTTNFRMACTIRGYKLNQVHCTSRKFVFEMPAGCFLMGIKNWLNSSRLVYGKCHVPEAPCLVIRVVIILIWILRYLNSEKKQNSSEEFARSIEAAFAMSTSEEVLPLPSNEVTILIKSAVGHLQPKQQPEITLWEFLHFKIRTLCTRQGLFKCFLFTSW